MLGFGLTLLLAAGAAAQADKRKELTEVQKQLEATRREIERYQSVERSLSRELNSLQGRNSDARRRLELLQKDMRQAEERRLELKTKLGALGRASGLWRDALARDVNAFAAARAAAHDAYGRGELWSDAFRRAAILEKVDLVANLEGFSRKTALAEAEARRRENELSRRRQVAERERRASLAEMERKRAAMAEAQSKMKAAQARAKELEENARALTRLLRNLERSQPGPAQPPRWEVAAHSLPWPAAGRVLKAFGRQKNPELGTWFIHQGLLLETAAKAPVTPVERGRVIFAGPFRSYGQVMILDHGGGFFSIYGELGEILKAKGSSVRPGEVIGTAAARPDGKGSLYLEIRRGTEALDPLQWLKKL